MEVEFQTGDDDLLYESVVEEIALEGLDGITIQGLFERLIDREGAPISRHENYKVLSSIWNCVKNDDRLRFYLLPEDRPNLHIWNRNLHLDPRGKFEEPENTPEDIYKYQCIEVLDSDQEVSRLTRRAQRETTKAQKLLLRKDELGRIQLPKNVNSAANAKNAPYNNGEIELEGIRFSSSSYVHSDSSKNQSQKQKASDSSPVSPTYLGHKTKKGKEISEQGPSKNKKSISKGDANRNRNPKKSSKTEPADEEGGDGKSSDKLVAIRGSCTNFGSRTDITQLLRRRNVSYVRATKMFGNKLVIVASQFLRESLLFSQLNQMTMNGPQYCVVERVGRARHYGEQARGKVSLCTMKIDPKAQFYHRKILLAEGVISKQPLIMKFGKAKTGTLISVFHLPNFFRQVESAESVNIRKVFAYLCNSPLKMVEFFKIQHVFGKFLMRTLVEEYKEFVEVQEIKYLTMYPEALENESVAKRKESLLKRKLRVISLRNQDIEVRDIIQKQLSSSAGGGDEDDSQPDGQVQEQTDEQGDSFDWNYCYSAERELAHEMESTRLLRLIISKGNKGAVQQDILREMSITNLDARSACRYLTRWKIVNPIMEDLLKTKVTRLVYWKCDGPCDQQGYQYLLSGSPNKGEGDIPNMEGFLETVLETSDMKVEDGAVREQILPFESDTSCSPQKLERGKSESPEKPSKPKKKYGWKNKKLQPIPVTRLVEDEPDSEDHNEDGIEIQKENRDGTGTFEIIKIEEQPQVETSITTGGHSVLRFPKRRKLDGCAPMTNDNANANLSNSIEQIIKRKKARPRKRFRDHIDLTARNKREKQRTEWAAEEDRNLLYVFIATILFIPRYNLDKAFVYNAIQLRDILHENVPQSRSKTCAGIRRRIHVILKNRGIYAKYRSLLNLGLRDEHMYTTFIEPHLPQPSITVFHKVPTEAVSAVFVYLKQRFGGIYDIGSPTQTTTSTTEISSSSQPEIRMEMDLEQLLDARELRRMQNIWVDVWANVFYQFYRRRKPSFSVVPLESVLQDRLRVEGLVIEETSWTLPETRPTAPTTRQDPVIVGEEPPVYADEELDYVYEVSRNLMDSANMDRDLKGEISSSSSESDEDDPERISTLGKEDDAEVPAKRHRKESRPTESQSTARELRLIRVKLRESSDSDVCSCERNPHHESQVSMWTGRTAMMSVLMGGGGELSSIRRFMGAISDSDLEFILNSFRSKRILTMVKPTRKLVLSGPMRKKLANFLQPMTFKIANLLLETHAEMVADLQTCLGSGGSTSLKDFNHLGTAYLLSEISPLVNLDIRIQPSIITVNEEWTEDYDSILNSSRLSNEEHKEHVALRLLRFKINADTEKGKFVEKDFFNINLPQLEFRPKEGVNIEAIVYGDGVTPPNAKVFLENRLLQMVEFDLKTGVVGATGGERMALGRFNTLYDVINIAGVTGISLPFLLKHFKKSEVKQGLMYLIDCNYVYMVGIRHRKFVAAPHMQSWTTLIPETNDGSRARRVVMRPWVDSTGGMNWRLVDRAFVGILGILQRYPFTYVQELCQTLVPLFSHVEVFFLLSALVNLGIVDIFQLPYKRQRRFNLFSKWVDQDDEDNLETPLKSYNVDGFLEIESVWAELMPFHVTRYAKVQGAIVNLGQGNPLAMLAEELQEGGSETILGVPSDQTPTFFEDTEDVVITMIDEEEDDSEDSDEDEEETEDTF